MKKLVSIVVLALAFGGMLSVAQAGGPNIPAACRDAVESAESGVGKYRNYEVIIVEDSFDETFGGNGSQIIIGTDGPDFIDAGSGNDLVCGNGGGDEIFGGSGNDELFGNGGSDDIFGGTGADFIDGGNGDNFCDGGTGSNTIVNCGFDDDDQG